MQERQEANKALRFSVDMFRRRAFRIARLLVLPK
jgi:hypothetical protein